MPGIDANAGASGDKQNADQGWDTYNERVLRNEGRLEGLEQLVKETRAADAKLVEMRSSALAKELSDTAASLQHLMAEQRAADKDEFRAELASAKELAESQRDMHNEAGHITTSLLRELYETSVEKNYDQSQAAIKALEERTVGHIDSLKQQVLAWRDSDREARDLQALEYARRLDVLNHANDRQQDFQSKSVTRELWDAEHRSMTEKINTLERQLIGMPTQAQATKEHDAINKRLEDQANNTAATADARMAILNEKIGELKEWQLRSTGRGQGYQQLYGWAIAAIGLIISVIIVANTLLR